MKSMKTILSFMVVFIFILSSVSAQNDSVSAKLPKFSSDIQLKHNPKIASYLSIIPGAGQIYNKKYWKLPIIYAGLGTASYLINYYYNKSQYYRDEYVYRINNGVAFHNPDLADKPTENILATRNTYRSRMEISIAAFAIVYALNILDATVDAHLYYFDISDDLSMTLKPSLQMYQYSGNYTFAPSVGLKLKLK